MLKFFCHLFTIVCIIMMSNQGLFKVVVGLTNNKIGMGAFEIFIEDDELTNYFGNSAYHSIMSKDSLDLQVLNGNA